MFIVLRERWNSIQLLVENNLVELRLLGDIQIIWDSQAQQLKIISEKIKKISCWPIGADTKTKLFS